MSQRAPPAVQTVRRPIRRRWAVQLLYGSTLITVAVMLACSSEEPTGPGPPSGPTVSAITVTSAIDTLIALGHSAQMSASVTDATGNPISGVTITWATSDPAVATVSSSGVVTPVAPGPVDIIAGAGGVTGRIRLRMIDADLTTIEDLAGDAYVLRLVSSIDDEASAALVAELAAISSGLTAGNCVVVYQAVEDALDAIDLAQPILHQPGDPAYETERVMLAVLEVVFLRAKQLLNL